MKALLKKSPYVLSALFVLPLFSIYVWAFFAMLGNVSDFPAAYAAASLASQGKFALIYDLQTYRTLQHSAFSGMGERVCPFFWPPVALILLLPFGFLAPLASALVWEAVQIGAGFFSLLKLKTLFDLRVSSIWWIFVYLALSGPLFENIRLGQTAFFWLFCFLISIVFLQRKKLVLAALFLSFFAAKPQLIAAWLVMLLGLAQYRLLFTTVAFMTGFVLVSVFAFGPDSYTSYLTHLASQNSSQAMVAGLSPELHTTFRGQLLRLLDKSTANFISLGLLGMSYAFIFFAGTKVKKQEFWLEKSMAIALPLGLLFSPHCHEYDLLLLTPAIVGFEDLLSKGRLALEAAQKLVLKAARLVFLLIFFLPVYFFIHYELLIPGKTVIDPLFVAFAFYAFALTVAGFKAKALNRAEAAACRNSENGEQAENSEPA